MRTRLLPLALVAAVALAACGGAAAEEAEAPKATAADTTTTVAEATTTTTAAADTESVDPDAADIEAVVDDGEVLEDVDLGAEYDLPDSNDLSELLVGASPACVSAVEAMTAAIAAYSAGFSNAMIGEDVDTEVYEEIMGQIEALRDAAPAEIKDDLDAVATELGKFYGALAEADFDLGSDPSLADFEKLNELAESVDQAVFDEASANIDAWFEQNCG